MLLRWSLVSAEAFWSFGTNSLWCLSSVNWRNRDSDRLEKASDSRDVSDHLFKTIKRESVGLCGWFREMFNCLNLKKVKHFPSEDRLKKPFYERALCFLLILLRSCSFCFKQIQMEAAAEVKLLDLFLLLGARFIFIFWAVIRWRWSWHVRMRMSLIVFLSNQKPPLFIKRWCTCRPSSLLLFFLSRAWRRSPSSPESATLRRCCRTLCSGESARGVWARGGLGRSAFSCLRGRAWTILFRFKINK